MEWDKLREMLWSENCIISPGGFISSVQKVAKIKDKDIFTGFAQNDSSEFLGFIIDCFHTAIQREVNMTITGTAESDTDKLAQKCYGMMKNMYKKEYSEFLNMFYGIQVSKIVNEADEFIVEKALNHKRRVSGVDGPVVKLCTALLEAVHDTVSSPFFVKFVKQIAGERPKVTSRIVLCRRPCRDKALS